jgi:hypothetical protein
LPALVLSDAGGVFFISCIKAVPYFTDDKTNKAGCGCFLSLIPAAKLPTKLLEKVFYAAAAERLEAAFRKGSLK